MDGNLASDSGVQTAGRSSLYHLRARTVNSLDACPPFVLRDGGSSRIVLESQRECGAVWGFDKCLQLGLGWSVFLAVYGVMWENFSVYYLFVMTEKGSFWQ